jgi:ketosteroid isomerase-like protein
MSQENVELVRGFYEALGQSGTDLRTIDEWLDPARTDLVEPDFEMAFFPPFLSGPFRGQRGLVDFTREFNAMWEEYQLEPEQFLDTGDRVAVVMRFRGRGKGGGAPVDERIAHVFTLREGKLVRADFYSDPDEALKAVGLSE